MSHKKMVINYSAYTNYITKDSIHDEIKAYSSNRLDAWFRHDTHGGRPRLDGL